MKRRWTEDEIDYLILAYEDGESTIEEIADFLGRTKSSISHKASCLRNEGVLVNQGLRYWSNEDINKLKKYHGKFTNREIAKMLNKKVPAIEHQIQRLGLAKRKIVDVKQIKKLAQKGYTRQKIAFRMGVSYIAIKKNVAKHRISVTAARNSFKESHKKYRWY